MSNRITIARTEFADLDTGEKSYGFRLYDSYGSFYCNSYEKSEIPSDDIELLKLVLSEDGEVVRDIKDFIQETECGITIGNEYYDYEEIESVFNDEFDGVSDE